MLTRKDLMELTGLGLVTVRKYYPFPGKCISKVAVANRLAAADNM
jgi:hypothetical protein